MTSPHQSPHSGRRSRSLSPRQSQTDSDIEAENEDYNDALHELSKDWLEIEINHHVSKTATNKFWEVATKKIFPLFQAKKRQKVEKKTPQFRSMREKLNRGIPPISMEIGYVSKTTGELIVKKDLQTTPVREFPPSEYQKVYEIASVQVRITILKLIELNLKNILFNSL